MSHKCLEYVLGVSACSCQISLIHGSNVQVINLHGATVREIDAAGNFHIQGINSGAKVLASSGFSAADVEALICACHGGGGGGSGEGISETLVTDDNDVVHIRQTRSIGGVKTTFYRDPDTDVVTTPTFPLKTSGEDWELLVLDDLVDDVVGDESGALNPFNELYKVDPDGTRTLIGTVDDKGVDYTVLGTIKLAGEIGQNTKTLQRRLILTGGSWSPTALMDNYSYRVLTVANPATPPTFTDNANNVTPLLLNETESFSVIPGTDRLDTDNIDITANAGDEIKILYTEIVSV